MHNERILDHFRKPRNAGELLPPAVTIKATNRVCGDILQLSAAVSDGVVREARFKARGCVASIACGSALTEWLPGKSMQDLEAFTPQQAEELVGGLPNESKHAGVLCVDAVKTLSKSISGEGASSSPAAARTSQT